ncbi:hypothetical protein N566_07225 [Streptomycetaceae bacterium MP113-05]|nr:hypothetical protein N566_07225 [Streptomycetaceae bacterium MP113-05]
MLSTEARQRLAELPGLGGGNAWRIAVETNTAADLPVLLADKPLVDPDGALRSEFSLRELDALADAWSAWYLDRSVGPRDRVGVFLADTFAYQVHLTALARIGAIGVLINGRMLPELALGLLRRTGAVGLFTDRERFALLAGRERELPELHWTALDEEVGVLGARAPRSSDLFRHDDDDAVVICHSSGTTGAPKPVIWTHRQSVSGACYRLVNHPEPEDVRVLAGAPQSHSSAIAFTYYSLLAGVPTIGWSDPTGPGIAQGCATHRPTVVLAFNEALSHLATHDPEPADFESVEVWVNLGDCGHDAHMRRLMALGRTRSGDTCVAGSIIDDGLGSSELGWAALRRVLTKDSPARARHLGTRVPIAEVAVLNVDGSEAGPDEVGLLGVRSESVAHGYWNDSDTTYRSMLSGYWLSGDLVRRSAEGEYFHVDRAVDRIRTDTGDGYSALMEEELLLGIEELADCSVIAGQERGRTVPVALVTLRQEVAAADLLQRANAVLESAGQPSLALLEIAPSPEDVPLGPTGKVLKRQLREKYCALEDYQPAGPGTVAVANGTKAANA